MRKFWNVLIVLLIVFLIAGIALPFVLKQRENEARTRSNEKMKQCALAIHSFHDTYRKFPPAFDVGGWYPTEPKSLWFHVLPYVEADAIYKSGQTDALVSAYLLPSDTSAGDRMGTISVAANIRVFGFQTVRAWVANAPQRAVDVPVGENVISGLTMGRLTSMDGTSNILMLSTRYAHCEGRPTRYAADPYGNLWSERPPAGVGGFMGAGSSKSSATSERSVDATFQLMPLPENCVADVALYGHSFGRGGIATALCDGSVKNVVPTFDPRLYAKALSPGDGQVIGADWSED